MEHHESEMEAILQTSLIRERRGLLRPPNPFGSLLLALTQ